MATKTITFEILGEAIVNQSFNIPENYDVNGKSTEELYEDILTKFGSGHDNNVLEEDICTFEFKVDDLSYNGFVGYHTEKNGMIIDSFY